MFWTKKYFQAKSLLVLFSILLSFSLNAYNSFSLLKSAGTAHSGKVISVEEASCLPVNASNLFIEDEENETENEKSLSETAAFVICFAAGLNSYHAAKAPFYNKGAPIALAQPLFLSIRVLRL